MKCKGWQTVWLVRQLVPLAECQNQAKLRPEQIALDT